MPEDKLFVRDILEQLRSLDPRLLTNVCFVKTGSFPDMTRVHLLTQEHYDEEHEMSELIEAKRLRRSVEGDIKNMEEKRIKLRTDMDAELAIHADKVNKLTDLARRIKAGALQRVLPLP